MFVVRSFMGKLFKVEFDVDKCYVFYKIFNITVLSRTFCRGESRWKFLNFIKFHTSPSSTLRFLQPILIKWVQQRTLKKEFTLIEFITGALGSYLTMGYLNDFFRTNNICNPIFISQYKANRDVRDLFYPNIQFITIPKVFFEMKYTELKDYGYRGCHYYLPIKRSDLVQVEKSLNNGENISYNGKIREFLCEGKQAFKDPVIPLNDMNKAEDIIKRFCLKDNDFVYVVPMIGSSSTLPPIFWKEMCAGLRKIGYDIFLNNSISGLENEKQVPSLTLGEAKFIASKAALIVGGGGGIMDLVANNNSTICSIYLPFARRNSDFPYLCAERVLSGFSLKHMPSFNNADIHEYNAELNSKEKILESVFHVATLRKKEELCAHV